MNEEHSDHVINRQIVVMTVLNAAGAILDRLPHTKQNWDLACALLNIAERIASEESFDDPSDLDTKGPHDDN